MEVKKIIFRINQVRFTRIWRKKIFFNSSQLELKSDLARVETNSSWKFCPTRVGNFYFIQIKSLKHFYLGILNIFNWIKTMLIFQLELALLESACDFYQLESQHYFAPNLYAIRDIIYWSITVVSKIMVIINLIG